MNRQLVDKVRRSPFPNLQLPAGVEIIPTSANVDDDSGFQHINVIVQMNITGEELMAHLVEQVESAIGPVALQSDAMRSSASWTFEREPGQTWQSTLNVIKLQGVSNEYLLRAQAELQED